MLRTLKSCCTPQVVQARGSHPQGQDCRSPAEPRGSGQILVFGSTPNPPASLRKPTALYFYMLLWPFNRKPLFTPVGSVSR